MDLGDYFLYTELAVIAGIALDLLLGDPAWLLHPVVVIGKMISFLEKKLRGIFPKAPGGELAGGAVTAFIVSASTLLVTAGVSFLFFRLNVWLFFLLQVIWCWQAVAIKDMKKEAMGVYRKLYPAEDLPGARKQVARIVGRDTSELSAEGVERAAIESVAESFSDGVISPLFYMLIGGAPLALMYKSVNTMDSMIGYKNEKYLYFGRVAARMDDVMNFIPSRLAAFSWIAAAFFTGEDAAGAFRIWLRDRHKSPSPNAAQTESACAGSLGIRLLGPAYYFGELHDKEYVGDDDRPVEPGDIKASCAMMVAGSLIFAALGLLIRGFVTGII